MKLPTSPDGILLAQYIEAKLQEIKKEIITELREPKTEEKPKRRAKKEGE